MEKAPEIYRSAKVRQAEDESMPKPDAEIEDSEEIDDIVPGRAQQDEPADPDSKHKDKRKATKDRHKPYRTIERTRPK